MKKRLSAILVTVLMLVAILGSAFSVSAANADNEIVILFTHDVHGNIEKGFGYAGLAAYAKEMETTYGVDNVVLADTGDAISGASICTLTQGEAIIDIMNEIGYDVFSPGNHEFDFSVKRLLELTNILNAKTVSSNFIDLKTNAPVYDPYTIIDYNGVSVAYVGVSSTKSMVSSTPTEFQDADGNYIYDFREDETGAALYTNVQASVDAAIAAGAQYVVALAPMGEEANTALVNNTTGIDVVLDGSTHKVKGEKIVQDKNGTDVPIIHSNSLFASIGKVIINPTTDSITTTLINAEDYTNKDAATQTYIDGVVAAFEAQLNRVVATSSIELDKRDLLSDNPNAIMERGIGNFYADAYRAILDTDIGFVNQGGIRTTLPVGDITYQNIIDVTPFGNYGTVVRATGQTILDGLEMGAMNAPGNFGGFLHVSGMTYQIDTSIPSSVKLDEKGNFVSVDGEYRVKNVLIGGKPLDLNAYYTVGSLDYILTDSGNGLSMFQDAEVLKEDVMLDIDLTLKYITENLGGTIGTAYSEAEGRITIYDPNTPTTDPETDTDPEIPDTGNNVFELVTITLMGVVVLGLGTKLVVSKVKSDK